MILLALLLGSGLLYSMQYEASDVQGAGESPADGNEEDGAEDENTQIYNLEEAVQIDLAQDATSVSGSGVSVSANTITIRSAGTYRFSGTLENGQIYVDADGSDSVVLVLGGVDITNESEPAIYVENAGNTVIYLPQGSQNRIQSGEDTGGPAAEGEIDENAEAGTVYARDDLTLAGTGSLEVTGFMNNGIQTSNNLVIEGGIIAVDAVNNGIKGKDSVSITGGTITVTSGGDGIKSDDTTGEGYGVISIEDGDIQVTSGGDGVQAETVLAISGGSIRITSGGGSADAETVSSDFGFGRSGFSENWDMEDEDAQSTKGIKSGAELIISGGTVTVDSYDDSIHSNGTITVSGGSIVAASGDDGMHADTELTITGGTIEISQSYEGLEGNQILIEGGDIQATASDDGVNAYGGTGSWGTGKTTEETPLLLITGGTVYINAQGDGLDSNGDLTVEGGTITVDGPSDSANGAIDSGLENGGSCSINGGTLLAIGASGMAETFDSSSGQCSFLYSFSTDYGAGSVITVSDADGNILFEHTAARSFSSVVFSSSELEEGEVYQISVDGETEEVTLTSVSGSYSRQGEGSGGWTGSGNMGMQQGRMGKSGADRVQG